MNPTIGLTTAASSNSERIDEVWQNPNHAGLRMFSQRGNLMREDYSGDSYPPNGYILDLVVIYSQDLVDKFGEDFAKQR